MKRKYLIIVLCLACIHLAFSGPAHHLVRFVYDGDTILVEGGERVRYLGIDAPEMGRDGAIHEFMAVASREANHRLVAEKRVRLVFDPEIRDRFGRLLAYVFLENGEMVNALLVRNGFAHVMVKSPNLRYLPLLLEEQRGAMAKRLGIWSGEPLDREAYYVGNKNAYRFHRPGCPFGMKTARRNRVRFETRFQAFWEGFSPCRRCKP